VSTPSGEIAELSGDQRKQLLSNVLRDLADSSSHYPLSFAQERLWFLDRFETNSPLYNIPLAMRLPTAMDPGALDRALNLIVARHEALRTTFQVIDGTPAQVVEPQLEIDLQLTDLTAVGQERREQIAQELAGHEAREPFDLKKGPLLRARLLRMAANDYLFLLTIHHIVSDGWSMGLLMQELQAFYGAELSGRSADLPALPMQYGMFAKRQRRELRGELLERLLEYWREQLDNAEQTLLLPTDYLRPPVRAFRGDFHPLEIPAATLHRLKRLAQQNGATLFMVLMAAFNVLLGRYSGATDLSVGTPIANRMNADTEQLIGFFVNTLVIRSDLSGDPPFNELLLRVREATLGAYSHQELPFSRVVETLQPDRDLARNPLFQVMLVLQNTPGVGGPRGGGSDSSSAHAGTAPDMVSGTAKFDLTLTLMESDAALKGGIEYDIDLFRPSTIQVMARQLKVLLAALGERPATRLSLLPLSDDEERQSLRKWAVGAPVQYGDQPHLAAEVLRRAAEHPERTAVQYGEAALSYAGLVAEAVRIAHALTDKGVAVEERVGLWLEPSPRLVAAMLGVWLAGAAYVPLDLDSPTDRIKYALKKSGVRIVVTDGIARERLPRGLTRLLDLDKARLERFPEVPPARAIHQHGLAYVMFTSGSTGTPKGVAVTHRNLLWLLTTGDDYTPIRPGLRVAQGASCVFDASTFEIWAALGRGATVVGLAKETLLQPERLVEALLSQGIDLLYLTAALFHELASKRPTAFATLECLLVGGDVVDPRLTAAVLANGGPLRLVHVYGPTEATVFSSTHAVPTATALPRSLSIGKPIPGTTSYVLDANLEPAPVGIPGELYIAGDGLARGYLEQPAQSAAAFLPDPFAQQSGARMYRTGDLARVLPNGELEFLGRRDHQVKVRGFRVELGEIERVLLGHPAVANCVVILHPAGETAGSRRLVAYVSPVLEKSLALAELRSHASKSLPEYMVPAAWVVLDQWPLSATGKLNRAALPPPGDERPELASDYRPPQGAVEEVLCALFGEVLGTERVGVEDNFFELGGHSLLATQLITRIVDAFEVEFPLRAVFEGPTVREHKQKLFELAGQEYAERAAQLLLKLSDMSDDEVASLVQERNGPVHHSLGAD